MTEQMPVLFLKLVSLSQGEGGFQSVLLLLYVSLIGIAASISLGSKTKGDPLSRWSTSILASALAGMVALAIENHIFVIPDGYVAMSAWWLVSLIGLAPAMAVAGLLSGKRPFGWVASGCCLALSGAVLGSPHLAAFDLGVRSPDLVAQVPAASQENESEHASATNRGSTEPAQRPIRASGSSASSDLPRDDQVHAASYSEPETADADFVFPNLNFAYKMPEEGWRRIEKLPGSENTPGLVLALRRDDPEAVVGIFVAPMVFQVDEADLIDQVRRRFRSMNPYIKCHTANNITLSGVKGIAADYSIGASDKKALRHWVGRHGGFIYQIIVEADTKSRRRLASDFRQVADGFHLINKNLGGAHSGFAQLHDFGYRLALEGAGWVVATGNHATPWLDKIAIQAEREEAVSVISLPARCSNLEEFGEIAHKALNLETTASSFAGETTNRVPYAERAIDYTGVRQVGSKMFPYRLRLIAGSHTTHAVFVAAKGSDADRRCEDLLPAFQLTGNPAAADPPGNPTLRKAVAALANETGILEYDRNEKRIALDLFRVACEYEGENVVHAENYLTTLKETKGAQAALDWLTNNPADGLKEEFAAKHRGILLTQLGRYKEAIAAFEKALAIGPLDDTSLFAMAKAAVAIDRYNEVLAAFDRAISQRGGPKLTQWRAVLLNRAGRHDEAIAVMKDQMRASPEDASIAYSLVECYEEAEEYREGVRLCEAALTRFPESASDFLFLLGRLRIGEGNLEAARDSLQECLAKAPGDQDATDLLRKVAALMGKGGNEGIRMPITPVPLPPLVAQALANPPTVEYSESVKAVGVFDAHRVVAYAWQGENPIRATERLRFRILNRNGVESMTLLSTTFNPLAERLFVNELVVRDERGEEIGRGSVDDFYVMDNSADGLDSYDQVVRLPVPGVRPGCTIDLTLTTEKLSSKSGFGFRSRFLAGSKACGVNAACFLGDVERIEYTSNGVSPVRPDANTVAWIATNPAPAVDEPYQPDPESYLPCVHLNDARQDWQTIGSEYLDDLSQTLVRDQEVALLALELVDPAEPLARRIETLASYVQQTIAYQGLEFGVRGMIPHPVSRICRVRTGDCKDHALLLHHLLREAGVPSHLALVNSSGPVEPDLPSLDQFDHMVVAVPNLPKRDGSIAAFGLIDPTLKTSDPLNGTPNGLAGKHILLLVEDRPTLAVAPVASARDGIVDCKRTARIVADSAGSGNMTLQVSESVEFGNSLSTLLRMSLQGRTPREQRDTLQRMISGRQTVEISEVYLENLDDPAKPLLLRLEYVLADSFQEVATHGRPLAGKLPTHWADLYCSPEKLPHRQTPFEFSIPVSFRSITQVIPPKGYRIATESANPRTKQLKPIAWNWRCDGDSSGGARVVMELLRTTGTFAAAEYRPYQEAAEEAMRTTGRVITVSRTELASQR